MDFSEFVKGVELEQLHRNRFSTKFKAVRGFGNYGEWVRFIVSDSKNKVEQLSFNIDELPRITPKQYYEIMIHQWDQKVSPKKLDYFQAEWDRVNA